jgi:hypothetical protein
VYRNSQGFLSRHRTQYNRLPYLGTLAGIRS